MEANQIIRRPVLSEKSHDDIKSKKYWFIVDINANKTQIKKAVEEIFNVKVKSVNTSITAPKPKQQRRNALG